MEKFTRQQLLERAVNYNACELKEDSVEEYERDIQRVANDFKQAYENYKANWLSVEQETIAYSVDEKGNINGRLDLIKIFNHKSNLEKNISYYYIKK